MGAGHSTALETVRQDKNTFKIESNVLRVINISLLGRLPNSLLSVIEILSPTRFVGAMSRLHGFD